MNTVSKCRASRLHGLSRVGASVDVWRGGDKNVYRDSVDVSPMTICIAAIAKENDNEHIVFATDHMITTNMGQFEHSIVKYSELNKNTVAMLAGQALLFDDIVKINDDIIGYEEIKKQLFDNFKEKRKEIIENEIFDVFGIDQQFFVDSLQKQIPNGFISFILTKVSELRLKTKILLVGFVDSLAQITDIDEMGITDFRSMNFHAIGSGATQAVNTLLFQKHSKTDPLLITIYNVYKAKRNAEVSGGVGKETDLLVLGDDGVQQLSDDDIDILNKIYMAELQYGKNNNELDKINGGMFKCL